VLSRIQQLAVDGMLRHEAHQAEVATMLAEARAAYSEDGTPVLQSGGAAAGAAGGAGSKQQPKQLTQQGARAMG
jgi:hypothetical protein